MNKNWQWKKPKRWTLDRRRSSNSDDQDFSFSTVSVFLWQTFKEIVNHYVFTMQIRNILLNVIFRFFYTLESHLIMSRNVRHVENGFSLRSAHLFILTASLTPALRKKTSLRLNFMLNPANTIRHSFSLIFFWSLRETDPCLLLLSNFLSYIWFFFSFGQFRWYDFYFVFFWVCINTGVICSSESHSGNSVVISMACIRIKDSFREKEMPQI